MNAKDVIRGLFSTNDFVLNEYLKDLSDADLLVRPVPGANHVAWQLGHLINAEAAMLKSIPGTEPPELPAGWAEKYNAETSKSDTPAHFLSKTEYLALYRRVRAASIKALDLVSEADLDRPTQGRLAKIAPTHGALLALIANHPMMHAGQLVVLRRRLGKPIVI
jgi:uncharacterized damage-inducible protein DinB